MAPIARYLIFVKLLILIRVRADTYVVRVGTDQHVNEVDPRFLSFTVDPKYLFSSSEKYNSKESVCMASSLTPAYIRIAGPSTSHMTFHNSTITFTDLDSNFDLSQDSQQLHSPGELKVTHSQWKKFVQWAKATGFDLVFALNNEEKMESGLWDPNTALNILTVAEKADIGDIYWQLGYECRNQSIEEYLNDLQTLRLISESFPSGEAHAWRVVGGDVTHCLQTDSKSDFKDYVTLSDDMLDAVLLHGNSSAQELERLSEPDRLKLLKRLSQSTTPLWLTESPHSSITAESLRANPETFKNSPVSSKKSPESFKKGPETFKKSPESMESSHPYSELHRAADWMTSLGYSARNGFAVHFRELVEEELYEPTLSFYMALLFKNLVGERVLHIDMEASQAVLFAHCTSLRHKQVPGAVTLYGANLDDEPARFSVKLSRREAGGDVMQFILAHDHSGNIIVNGRAMYYEGDIRPVVKRLRPYKTLLINLPPKSFGFWVLANTNIEACHNIEDNNKKELVEALTVTNDDDKDESISIKTKRSMSVNNGHFDELDKGDAEIFDGNSVNEAMSTENGDLNTRIENLNNDLKKFREMFETKSKKNKEGLNRLKRQTLDQESGKRKLRSRQGLLHRQDPRSRIHGEAKPKLQLIYRRLVGPYSRVNHTRQSRIDRTRKNLRFGKAKLSKRNSVQSIEKPVEKPKETITKGEEIVTRKRRSVLDEKQNVSRKVREDISSENEIDFDNKEQKKLWKILHKIHDQLKDLPVEGTDNTEYVDYGSESKGEDEIVVKTKVSDDATKVKYSEKSKKGLLKSTVSNVVNVLGDLNDNLNRFWNALHILE